MTFSYTDFGFLLILEPGDEVVRCLIQFARDHEIEAACITGTGAVSELELGTGGTGPREHRRTRVTVPLEVCALNGVLSLVDGEPFPHLHGSFARPDCSMLGGHVYEAVCATSVRVAVQASRVARSYDTTETGSFTRTGTGL